MSIRNIILFVLFGILIMNNSLLMANSPDHNYEAGRLAYISGDYNRAKKEFEIAAKEGHLGAQGKLGVMYYDGLGVCKDYHQAVKWWRLAAQQGDVLAQSMLGVMYYEGKGVKQNKLIAKEWCGKACDNGYQEACDNYRKLNEQGY